MFKENFANEILLKLDGQIPVDMLPKVRQALETTMYNYDIKPKETGVVVYEGLPDTYKMFLVAKKIEGRSEGTLKLYKMVIEDALYALAKPLKDVTTNDIRTYLYQTQKNRKVSERTMDSRRLILNGFFKWCWEEGYIDRNPCAQIKPIHYECKQRHPLSDVEMVKLRKGCANIRDKAILETFVSSGCRCSELCNLDIKDLDFDTRRVELFGKGKKYRQSEINAEALLDIKEYLATRDDDNPALFVGLRKPHKRLTKGGVENIIQHIAERAGVENVFPHRLRHTFATNAINKGMDIVDVQFFLGHSSVETTQIYAKRNPENMHMNYKKYIS